MIMKSSPGLLDIDIDRSWCFTQINYVLFILDIKFYNGRFTRSYWKL